VSVLLVAHRSVFWNSPPRGTVTGLSAGLVIGLGAVAGALIGLAGYGVYRSIKKKQKG
jgi:hypothetical protein